MNAVDKMVNILEWFWEIIDGRVQNPYREKSSPIFFKSSKFLGDLVHFWKILVQFYQNLVRQFKI